MIAFAEIAGAPQHRDLAVGDSALLIPSVFGAIKCRRIRSSTNTDNLT